MDGLMVTWRGAGMGEIEAGMEEIEDTKGFFGLMRLGSHKLKWYKKAVLLDCPCSRIDWDVFIQHVHSANDSPWGVETSRKSVARSSPKSPLIVSNRVCSWLMHCHPPFLSSPCSLEAQVTFFEPFTTPELLVHQPS